MCGGFDYRAVEGELNQGANTWYTKTPGAPDILLHYNYYEVRAWAHTQALYVPRVRACACMRVRGRACVRMCICVHMCVPPLLGLRVLTRSRRPFFPPPTPMPRTAAHRHREPKSWTQAREDRSGAAAADGGALPCRCDL